MIRRIFLLPILLAILAMPSALGARELVKNGSFAKGKTKWSMRKDQRYDVDKKDTPAEAKAALRVTVVKATGYHGYFDQAIPSFKKNTTYSLSGWVKSDVPGRAYLQVKLYKNNGKKRTELRRFSSGASTTNWLKQSVTFSTENADSVLVMCRFYSTQADVGKRSWFTNVSLKEKVVPMIDLSRKKGEHKGFINDLIRMALAEVDQNICKIGKGGDDNSIIFTNNATAATIFSQRVKLRKGQYYRLLITARGPGQMRFYWHPGARLNVPNNRETLTNSIGILTNPSDETTTYNTIIEPTADGMGHLEARIPYYTVRGQCRVTSMRIIPIDKPVTDQAIPVKVGADEYTVAKKLLVETCHVVRGFCAAPVDGSVRSRHYSGRVYEVGDGLRGQAVTYNWNNLDGTHVTLADDGGFDYVALRGGATARMYADAESYNAPGKADPLWEFTKRQIQFDPKHSGWYSQNLHSFDTQGAMLEKRVKTKRVSFFNVYGGKLADVSFHRISQAADTADAPTWRLTTRPSDVPEPKDGYDVENPRLILKRRYPKSNVPLFTMGPQGGKSVSLKANTPAFFISKPMAADTGLASITLEATVGDIRKPIKLTVAFHDPLAPRRELQIATFNVEKSGRIRIGLDFPNQVLFKGKRLWLTLMADQACNLGTPTVRPAFIPVEAARPEALAWRKLLMKSLYIRISEPRSWMRYKNGLTRRQACDHYEKDPRYTGFHPGIFLHELFETLDYARKLGPEDNLVRQYSEWCLVGDKRPSTPIADLPKPPADVPDWAFYGHMAWMKSLDLATKWYDERYVPNGELGGRVNDDTCFSQQLADFPMFQSDGVIPRLKDSGRRLLTLAENKTLRDGINARNMDPLHGYEEGINQITLLARWNYGDPLYTEKLMKSARSTEKLTVLTHDGRRHFRGYKLGQPRTHTDGKMGEIKNSLLWFHPTLLLADYNRNPRSMKLLIEWADTWHKLQVPGKYPRAIDVESGKTLEFRTDKPYYIRGLNTSLTWLAQLTGETRWLSPFKDYLKKGQIVPTARGLLGDFESMGYLDDLSKVALDRLKEQDTLLPLRMDANPKPYIEQRVIGNKDHRSRFVSTLHAALRFPDMMGPDAQYTDRVWFKLMTPVSEMYLGGHTKRNKFNPSQAVSWDGMGTDFAALVTRNRKDGLRISVYNFRKTPMTARMKVWRLEHGEYRFRIGPDANSDQRIDKAISEKAVTLAKADEITFELPPRKSTVIELTQTKKLESIFTRADLAVSAREIRYNGRTMECTVHNLGSAPARDFDVAIVDAKGQIVAKARIAKLDAPLDLMPRTATIRITLPTAPAKGWKLIVDPARVIPEIYEGNNVVELK
jgi:Carbohydrate binding domain